MRVITSSNVKPSCTQVCFPPLQLHVSAILFLLVICGNMGVSFAVTLMINLMKIDHMVQTLKQCIVQSCLHEYSLLYLIGRVLQNQTVVQFVHPKSEVCILHVNLQNVILQHFIKSEPEGT